MIILLFSLTGKRKKNNATVSTSVITCHYKVFPEEWKFHQSKSQKELPNPQTDRNYG